MPAAAEPEIVEGLVVPVRGADGPPLGTLWAVHHDGRGRIDAEDARVMEELAVQMTLALWLLRDAAAQEVHHWVNNKLAATAGVLRLQARAVPSVEARAGSAARQPRHRTRLARAARRSGGSAGLPLTAPPPQAQRPTRRDQEHRQGGTPWLS